MKEYKQETLILVAEDGNKTEHIVPYDSDPKTIARAGYELLAEHKYTYNEKEYHFQLHRVILKKKNKLNLDSYDIRRSQLVQKYGWGVHVKDRKLALVAVDSGRYEDLLNNPDVIKVSGWRLKRRI
jgi:hypothetical protein